MKGVLRRLRGAIGNAVVWGGTGLVTGFAFSPCPRLRHFDRPLIDIRVGRTALVGGSVAVAVSLGIGALVRLSMGLPIALGDVIAGVPTLALFGAETAAATLHIAQRSARALTADRISHPRLK